LNRKSASRNRASASLVAELERRIAAIESPDAAEYGQFNRLDWWACVLGGLLLPYLAVLWFWP
jgi:hypothetical protein